MTAKILFIVGAVLVLTVVGPFYSMAATMYVQPNVARVMAKPSLSSPVLGTLASGEAIETSGKTGAWVRVGYRGGVGYIYASQLAGSAPPRKFRPAAAPATPKLTSRDRDSSPVAVAGVKGLTYEDRARANRDNQANYSALDAMDKFAVAAEEVKTFQSGGMP